MRSDSFVDSGAIEIVCFAYFLSYLSTSLRMGPFRFQAGRRGFLSLFCAVADFLQMYVWFCCYI